MHVFNINVCQIHLCLSLEIQFSAVCLSVRIWPFVFLEKQFHKAVESAQTRLRVVTRAQPAPSGFHGAVSTAKLDISLFSGIRLSRV